MPGQEDGLSGSGTPARTEYVTVPAKGRIQEPRRNWLHIGVGYVRSRGLAAREEAHAVDSDGPVC